MSDAWGYACCHSLVHASYCSGQAGIEAAKASSAQNLLSSSSAAVQAFKQPSPEPEESSKAQNATKGKAEERQDRDRSKRLGEGDIQLDKERLAKAIAEEKKRKQRADDEDERWGKKKKGPEGNSEVTEEQLGMSSPSLSYTLLTVACRGIPNESPHDGRSYGQLRRHWRHIMRLTLDSYTMHILSYYVVSVDTCKRKTRNPSPEP